MMIGGVLLPYGFLLEDNSALRDMTETAVLLPYGFLLEDNELEDKVK